MRQILQNMTNGLCSIVHAPTPQVDDHSLLIATTKSLISAGTEKMLVDFGKASYISKARMQPEKMKMIIEKVKTNGLISTIAAIHSKLAQPLPLGYCNVGVVTHVGKLVSGFKTGDRVVSNGPHADVIKITKNLCMPIPVQVDDETAVFTVLASIGLQGIRLVAPTIGEAIAVIGIGLIGLLIVQLLLKHGCRVIAFDFDANKLILAAQFGAEIYNCTDGDDSVAAGLAFSRGHGVDAVIIAAATKSNDPITQAARMSRKRGRIVLVGVTGLKLNRSEFYAKELTFQVSCSTGPGRYEQKYEEQGLDYPISFVRWTERRNFEAILDLMANNTLNIKSLISHRYAFEDAQLAYKVLTADQSALGILLEYNSTFANRHVKTIKLNDNMCGDPHQPILGFVGAGNYASRQLIPAFKAAGGQLHTIVSTGGINAAIYGKKAGFSIISTELNEILNNQKINTIVIVTRHDSHAEIVIKALAAGKNVFVEKPLALNLTDLNKIVETYYAAHTAGKKLHLMVGFNRRFAPLTQKTKALLKTIPAPKFLIMTINAGDIAHNHWSQDQNIGGGRIIGDACHFIDLMRFLVGKNINLVRAECMKDATGSELTDNATITLGFADGSFGSIHYLANGSPSFPKERIEIFAGGRILQLDNFRKLKGFGWQKFSKVILWRQDKGQVHCARAFLQTIKDGSPALIPSEELFEVARISIEAAGLVKKCQL